MGIFKIKIDATKLDAEFSDMNKALKKAVVNSLNTIGRRINKEIGNDIKRNYNIKARSLRLGKTVRLIRADARKVIPFFTISILKKGRGLFLYNPKQTQAGISVKIKKGRKTVKGSYFIRSKAKNRLFVARKSRKGGMVQRTTAKGRRYMAPRSEFLFGPSIASLYRRRKSLKLIDIVINRDYEKLLDAQFDKQFDKRV